MPGRLLAAVAMAALLGGCLSGPGAERPAAEDPQPSIVESSVYQGTCRSELLFQFVDYAGTDTLLPPGFHPRDPQEFLGTPAAFGQAGVLFIVLACTSAAGEPLVAADTAVFVEPPSVDGVKAGAFDFYEVERFGSGGLYGDVFERAGWPVRPADAAFVTQADDPLPPASARVLSYGLATLSDGDGQIAQLFGIMSASVQLQGDVARFWHDGPAGVAYVEYRAVLDPIVGGGTCNFRADTAMHALTGDQCPSATTDGAASEPIIAAFPDLVLNTTAVFLPGVHAR